MSKEIHSIKAHTAEWGSKGKSYLERVPANAAQAPITQIPV